MNPTTTFRPDKIWLTGIFLLAGSFFIFCIPLFFPMTETPHGLFFLNYITAIVYFAILLLSGRLSKDADGLPLLFVFLVLSLISCYALNRTLSIFEDSVPWWSTLLIISSVNYLATPFYGHFPRWLQYLSAMIAGVALLAFLYLALYLVPFYLVSLPGIIVVGLGAHSFVPVLFIIYTILFIRRVSANDRRNLYAFLVGVAIALGTVIQFSIRWHAEVGRVDNLLFKNQTADNTTLPGWVAVAQQGRRSTFNEHFLKAGLVYELPGPWDWDFFGFDRSQRLHEHHRHDPLIMLAANFGGRSNLQDEDRIKILESLYDSRHAAQERLWSDDALSTANVKTSVELWPRLHLSYTEEELIVIAQGKQNTWEGPQEALYTFHLPEGATVSSLSLWVNGHEEKGILTSRHKADAAYQQIVGYEHRDPSVVHWQEGNKVVVRVFPVQPYEPRRFKIGITAPLESHDNQLVYHSIYFDGPPAGNARGSVNIHPFQPLDNLQQTLTKKDAYQPDWTLSFRDPGITPQTFQFNGQQYTTAAAVPAFDDADIQKVYLDLNNSWTHQEFTALLPILKDKKVYAWIPADGLVKLTPANQEAIYHDAATLEFGLFPLSRITDKEHALLVSKSNPASPALSDLNNTDFAKQLQTWLAAPGKLRLYNIGDELSPYLKTLKECGAFHFEKGNWVTLDTCIIQHRFLHDNEQPDVVSIDPAGLLIRREPSPASTGQAASNAPATSDKPAVSATETPDHLLRLFAYRRIQQQLDGKLPGDLTYEDPATVDSLVATAQEAGIVSPVSSLVVLETQDDYKRFDITQSQNSLANASLHGKGAVPEPGEWALFLTALAVFLFIRLRANRGNNIRHA